MISHESSAQFAEEWVAAWNSRDLGRILPHYADDVEMASSLYQRDSWRTFRSVEGQICCGCVLGESSCSIAGIAL